MLLGGAAINRKFGYRASYVNGKKDETIYEPGVFYCKDAFEGLAVMDKLVEPADREEFVAKTAIAAAELRKEVEVVDTGPPVTDDSVRSAVQTDLPVPSRRSGASTRSTCRWTRSTTSSTRTCSTSSTGAAAECPPRGYRKLLRTTFSRASSACGRSRTTCTRAPSSATSLATPWATRSS